MRSVISILLLFTGICSFSQQYNLEILGIKRGLLHSVVTGIDQDNQGRVWLSTGGGLCNYNGYEFNYYTTKDGLNYTRLTDVVVDEMGGVWAGSTLGINYLFGGKVYSVPKDSVGGALSFSRSTNGIWVLSDRGVYKLGFYNQRININGWPLPNSDGLDISAIFQDRPLGDFIFQTTKGESFLGYKGEFYKIINGDYQRIGLGKFVAAYCCFEDDKNEVILGTSKGLYKLIDDKPVRIDHPVANELEIYKIAKIDSVFWCIGRNKFNEISVYGFTLKSHSFKRRIGVKNGLPDLPTKLYVDHEKNLWILTNNGIGILKGVAFTAYTKNDGLIGNKIWGVSKTRNGYLWIGTIGEGLSIMTPNGIYRYSTQNGLPDNYIGKVFEASDGKIYVGTSNAGICLAMYQGAGKGYRFRRLPLLQNQELRIDDIIEDENKILWVATSKGLYYTKNGVQFCHYKLFASDTGNVFIQKLQIDTIRNRIWVGTRFNGVYYIEQNKVFSFNEIGKNAEISTLLTDTYGNVWFGTRNEGVYGFNGNELKQIKEADGLSSNLIYLLYADKEFLWVGTNLGLDRLSIHEFLNDSLILRHYGPNEGLPDLEINLNGVLSDSDKGFWIATNSGLAYYQRAFDKINSVPPVVSIKSVLLRSQKTNWRMFTDSIDELTGLPLDLKLRHNQNHITFEFEAISFKNPQEVKYAWYLEGLDDTWVETKSRQAIFSSLAPGKTYRLHLKAANSDGVWSDEIVSMPIYIAPPFWATWWFRILFVLVLGLVLYLYTSSRIKTLKERQEELEEMVEQRTVELKEQLSIVDEKNKQITDSIKYAKFLQASMLPSIEDLKTYFTDTFLFYKPKDYVSGDFYWFFHYKNKSIFAVADCTGHGVPGAIVSVICENALRTALRDQNYSNTPKILLKTNRLVVDFFSKSQKSIIDGMEIALCVFDHNTMELEYSGAKMPLYIISDGQLVKLRPDIYRIGWDNHKVSYTSKKVKLAKNDIVFAFTDGYCDQFSAENGEKFSSTRLKNLILENYGSPCFLLENKLAQTFEKWRGFNEQIDDVLVLGIKI
ncbi:SpoIIE family protein phosphatase [Tenuifilum thalassicum]|uniref:SpoIIE family protein phosphatase n=1 Tax=Tenuifilum thalassicum TaxID=2590900 RepID=A0A7D3XMJ2_9BACT|nr:SpoIIE family protein phosphatase [Tenuifilum thalassicum]